MKSKKLKYPFNWENRAPLLKEGIFYVPEFYQNHNAQLFPDWEELFGNPFPVNIEYCSGNGEWIVNKAREDFSKNWVAVEHNFKRVRKIFSKRESCGLKNLFIISGDAFTFAREYIRKESVTAAYVNFPDPWPKKRHAKHRLIQKPFIKEVQKTLKKEGSLTLVTDSIPYSEQMKDVVDSNCVFEQAEYSDTNNYGSSYFNSLWTSLGRSIHFLHYQKIYD